MTILNNILKEPTAGKYKDYELQRFFMESVQDSDRDVYNALTDEFSRQHDSIELIASENIASRAVLDVMGSILTNKYAEGYPGKRYYGGCEHVDVVESLAIERAKALFECGFANVQPHSGSQANFSVFLSCLTPGDTILGMSLDSGGHLTHGAKPSFSGKYFNVVQYGVDAQSHNINYDEVEKLAQYHKPKLIIAGGSAVPRQIDFKRFREIADKVGALLLVDMAHFAGLVAGKAHPSPLPYADIVTCTTHKTLRGPRGGMILTNKPEIAKKVNSAVFPGSQGGPLLPAIAGKAVAFKQALQPEFRVYTQQVIRSAQALSRTLVEGGYNVVTGGTDTHLVLVDLTPKSLTGDIASLALERAGITCNKNAIPFDREKAMVTSGIRLGTPSGVTRGFGEKEFILVGELMINVLDGLAANGPDHNQEVEKKTFARVVALCRSFPIY